MAGTTACPGADEATGQGDALLPGIPVARATPVAGLPTSPEDSAEPAHWPQASFAPTGDCVCYRYSTPGPGGVQYALRLVALPDGRTIATSLVPEFGDLASPRVGPDGKRLLFTGRSPEAPAREPLGVWLTDLTGASPERLTPRAMAAASPAWTPGGGAVAFVTPSEDAQPDVPASAVALLDLDHRELIPQVPLRIDRFTVDVEALNYSPDGRWLACAVLPGGRLAVLDVELAKLHVLLDPQWLVLAFSPEAQVRIPNYAWLPDSRRLLVTVEADDAGAAKHCIWLVHITGERRRLTEGRVLGGTADGRVLFVQKDGRNWRLDLP